MGGYVHWGNLTDGNMTLPEPNNIYTPELCAVAAYNESHGKPVQAWGWADANCNHTAIFICRRAGESPRLTMLPCVGAAAGIMD